MPPTSTSTTSRITTDQLERARALVASVDTGFESKVVGQRRLRETLLIGLLTSGHVLLESVPGLAKTTAAHALATAIGGSFKRIQCTPDLLPSDITGTSVYSPSDGSWEFRPGPLFANVVLIDEVNRASPRTQAALLEPMEEHQVSVDSITHDLPRPFFCIATQNPFGQAGTFPLPESQLDRFAMVLSMGLPGRAAEREILTGHGGTDAFEAISAVTTPAEVVRAVEAARHVHAAPPAVEYVLDLAEATRNHPDLVVGVSPRATVGLMAAARSHALVGGRTHITPDDIQAVAVAALAHRVSVGGSVDVGTARQVVADVLAGVPVPRP